MSSHSTHSRTSAYTLPLKDPHEKMPFPSVDSHQEFASKPQSPSLPWFVDYWSSSFFQAPSMIIDQLCSCTSAASVSSLDEAYRVSDADAYFEDAIQKSKPLVETHPTKISQMRWDALRKVVASHDDTKDYLDETPDDYDMDCDSIYPTKPTNEKAQRRKRRSHQSSIVAEDDEHDDDVRTAPPAPLGPASPFRSSQSFTAPSDVSSGRFMDLKTCHSFDQYMETTQFLCASDTSGFTTPQASRPAATIPQAPSHQDRRRTRRQISLSAPMTPQRLSTRLPPSPAPSSADTYTTISLSQSFAREFESDDSFELYNGSDKVFHPLAGKTMDRSPFRKKGDANQSPAQTLTESPNPTGDDEAYRFLIRMSPTNYKHSSTDVDEGSSNEDLWSAASSSVLLPLHPHQRILLGPLDSQESFTLERRTAYSVPVDAPMVPQS